MCKWTLHLLVRKGLNMNVHIAQNFNISVGAELIEKLVGCRRSSSKGDDA